MIGMLVSSSLNLLPTDLVAASGFAAFGSMILPAVMVHLGTVIPVRELARQYKAILVAVGSMVVAAALILAAVTLIFDYSTAVAGVAPMLGGVVSTLLTVEGLQGAGYSALVALPVVVMMFATIPGMPIASTLLRRHAKWLVASEQAAPAGEKAAAPNYTPKVAMPRWFAENGILTIFILMAFGVGAYFIGNLTGVSYTIWGLALGFAAAWLGVLPQRAMQEANGFTLAMIAIVAAVLAPLLSTSLASLAGMLGIVLAVLAFGFAGLILGGAIMSKIVKWQPALGISVALTAVFGFPADYLITKEVAESTGKTPEQKQMLLDSMLPQMLIGGFTSVSAGSVVIASILVGTL